jgi:hypothetical protein
MFEQQPANVAVIGQWLDLRRHLRAPRQVVFRPWIEPPRRLRLSWRPEGGARRAHPTEVEVTSASEGATWLRLRHGPFASPEQAESHVRARGRALDRLALELDEGSR